MPFLDRRVIEWAIRRPVDPAEKVLANSKPVLRTFLSSHGLEGILNNPKQGFSLKVAEHYNQSDAIAQIEESWWVKSGFWHKDWKKIIDAKVSGRFFRIWSALMMAKWSTKWL